MANEITGAKFLLDNDGIIVPAGTNVLPEVEITDTRLPLFTLGELALAVVSGLIIYYIVKAVK